MAQQLNLYDTSLRPARVLLTPLRVLLGLLLLVALMAAGAQWLRLDAARWQAQAKALQAQSEPMAAALATLSGPTNRADPADLAALRLELAQAQLLAQARPPAAQRELPAQVMQALAEAAPGDVWLQRIQWQLQPRRLELEGGLLDTRRLPDYLRRLERQPALSGLQFGQLLLEPPAPAASGAPATFALRSQAKEANR